MKTVKLVYGYSNISVSTIYDINSTDNLITVKLPDGELLTKDQKWFNMVNMTNLVLPYDYCYLYKDIEFTIMRRPHKRNEMLHIPYIPYGKFKPIVVRFQNSDKEFAIPLPYSHYAVSRDGEIRQIEDGKLAMTDYSNAFGYLYAMLPNMNIRAINVHRLIAFAWIPNDDYENKYVVDHIDNDKLNNRIENLQWLTVSGNVSKEATLQCRPIIVRNVDTGEIMEFRSVSEASNKIGISTGFGRFGSLVRPTKIWMTETGRYEARYKDDFDGWVYEGFIPKAEYKYRITFKDNTKKYYYSLYDICKDNNLPSKTTISDIGKMINGVVESLIFSNEISNNEIEVYNIESKVFKTYNRISEIVKDTEIPESNIRRVISNKFENINTNGYLIRIKTDKPWDVSKIENRPNAPVKLYLINVNDDKDVREFESKKALGREVCLSNHQINNYVSKKLILTRNGLNYRIVIR